MSTAFLLFVACSTSPQAPQPEPPQPAEPVRVEQSSFWLVSSSADTVVDALTPSPISCSGPGCMVDLALKNARKGQLKTAAAQCLSANEERDQCMIRVGVTALSVLNAPGYATAAQLCASISEENVQNDCQRDLLVELANNPPPPHADPDAWVVATQTAEVIRITWQKLDPKVADWAVGRFWAETLKQSYEGQVSTVATPLLLLPEDAHPHVRAALTRKMVALGDAPESVEDWAQRFPPGATIGAAREGQTFYLGDAVRPTAGDAEVDLILGVLIALDHDGVGLTGAAWQAAGTILRSSATVNSPTPAERP